MRQSHKSVLPAILVGSSVAAVSVAGPSNPGLFSTGTAPVRVKVTAGVNVSDNRDLIPDNYIVNGQPRSKEDQVTAFVGPTFSFAKEVLDRYNIAVSYSPVYTWYDNVRPGQEESKWEHTARFALAYDITPRLSFELKENYWWSGQKEVFYGDDFSYDPNRDSRLDNDYSRNNFVASLRYALSDYDWAKVTGRWRIKRYDEKELADYNDEDEYGARIDYMHVLSDRLSLGLFADYTSWDRESKNTDNGVTKIELGVEYVTAGVQATYDLDGTRNHILTGAIGWNHAWYEADDMDSQNLLGDSSLELRLFQLHETQLLGGFRFGRKFSDIYPFSSQKDLAGYLSVLQYLDNRRFKASASVEIRNRSYDLDDDIDPEAWKYGYAKALMDANNGKTEYDRDSVYARLQLSYRFTDYFTASAFYSYEKYDSDVSADYTENIFGVTGTIDLF